MSCTSKLHGGRKGKHTKRRTGKKHNKSARSKGKTAKKRVKKTSKRRTFFARLFNL